MTETFNFSAENQEKIHHILAQYPQGRQASAVLPLLDLAQRQNEGWLCSAAIETVATLLEMPVIRVFEVAHFYTMFNLKPVGKYHLQICRTTPCWLKGSDKILEKCKQVGNIPAGRPSADGLFSLMEVECLGACINAPVVQINDDYAEDLTPEKIEKILLSLKEGHSLSEALNQSDKGKGHA
jgi:NADH-quinone oxidoreductase subunit E